MAVVRGNTNQTSGNTDANGTMSFTLNVAAGSNKAVLVYVISGASTDPTTVTVGGVTATLIRKNNNGSYYCRTYIAVLGSTTGNQTVLMDYASAQTLVGIGATDFSNVNQSSPVDIDNGGTFTLAASGNNSVSATATYGDGYSMGIMAGNTLGAGFSPNGSETELMDVAISGGPRMYAQGKDGVSGSNTQAFHNADTFWDATCAAQIVVLRIASVNTNDERSAKITGVYATKQSQSLAVAEPASPITKAIIMPTTTEPDDSSIDWYLSADGGSHWEAVTPNVTHTFTNLGQDLRWRAIHNPSTDGFDFPTIQKVVLSWELGTPTNSERSAKITGKTTANSERSAKITGQDTANSERNAKITGTATANSERSGKITGQDTSNSERSAKLTGTSSVDTSSERSAKITGTLNTNSERDAKLLGLEGSNSERNAKLTGTATTNSERNAKITGTLDTNSERAGKITGTATANSERGARLIGAVPDERAVKIYAGFSNTVSDTFDTTDNKDAVNTTAKWEGDGEITLG